MAIALTVGVVWTLATHVGWTLCALIPAGGDLAAYHADPASVWARVGLGFCPEAGTGELTLTSEPPALRALFGVGGSSPAEGCFDGEATWAWACGC